ARPSGRQAFAEPGDVRGHVAFGLADHGGVGGGDDLHEEVGGDGALAEVDVPVATGTGVVSGVVGVHEVDASGDLTDLPGGLGQVEPAGPGVTGVEAEADLGAAVGLLDRGPELFDPVEPACHRVVTARGVLHEHRHL